MNKNIFSIFNPQKTGGGVRMEIENQETYFFEMKRHIYLETSTKFESGLCLKIYLRKFINLTMKGYMMEAN